MDNPEKDHNNMDYLDDLLRSIAQNNPPKIEEKIETEQEIETEEDNCSEQEIEIEVEENKPEEIQSPATMQDVVEAYRLSDLEEIKNGHEPLTGREQVEIATEAEGRVLLMYWNPDGSKKDPNVAEAEVTKHIENLEKLMQKFKIMSLAARSTRSKKRLEHLNTLTDDQREEFKKLARKKTAIPKDTSVIPKPRKAKQSAEESIIAGLRARGLSESAIKKYLSDDDD